MTATVRGCLTRQVTRKTKDEDGDEIVERVTQYYHRLVVAMLIAPRLDLTLAIEPVCSEAMRVECGEAPGCGDEGELTAALRLIDRLHDTYGCFIDAFALDGLYPCGPVFEKLSVYNYGAFVTTRDDAKDPYRFAESIWAARGHQPDEVTRDPERGDTVELLRLNDVDTLSRFEGSVDMLKAVVTRKKGQEEGHEKHTRPRRAPIQRLKRSLWRCAAFAQHLAPRRRQLLP